MHPIFLPNSARVGIRTADIGSSEFQTQREAGRTKRNRRLAALQSRTMRLQCLSCGWERRNGRNPTMVQQQPALDPGFLPYVLPWIVAPWIVILLFVWAL